jgi:glycerol-3-phosphate cytidylyltransferase
MEDSKPEIGVITGNFDIIHLGYVRLFKELHNSCHQPIILLHDDPTIERPEKLKPIHTIDERIELIQPYFLFDLVQFLIYNTEAELYTLLKAIRPDIRLMGDDYIDKPYTGDDLGIPIKWIDRSHGWSTTIFKKLIASTICK